MKNIIVQAGLVGKMIMMESKEKLIGNVREACMEWLEENAADYDDWLYACDDMIESDMVSGNESGYCPHEDDSIAHEIVWDYDFINYAVSELGFNLDKLIQDGEETVYCLGCYWIFWEYLYEDCRKKFEELKDKELEDENC